MSQIKVAICDDNPEERQYFLDMCKKIKEKNDIHIKVGIYETGDALLFDFEDSRILNSVDIVLLDIYMPGNSGIDVAQKIREQNFNGSIIFITRSDEYWKSAFDVNAFNYIIKGNDVKERFSNIFIKAIAEARKRRSKMFVFSSIHETRQVPIDAIKYFEIDKHVVTVHYNQDDNFNFISSLVKVESMLFGHSDFVRIHRSFIISLSHLSSDNISEKSVKMFDGKILPVSRKYTTSLREAMSKRKNVNL